MHRTQIGGAVLCSGPATMITLTNDLFHDNELYHNRSKYEQESSNTMGRLDGQQHKVPGEPRMPILDSRVHRPIGWLSTKGLYLWSRFSHVEIFIAWTELWNMQEQLQPVQEDESVAMVVLREAKDRG